MGQVRGKHGGYYSREYADTEEVGEEHPREEIQGRGYSFGYNRNEDIADCRTSEQLVHLLVNTRGPGRQSNRSVGRTGKTACT
jgi:alpha-L-fucosidase